MNWHYATDGGQKGPVNDAEFQQLVQQGVITPQTLVWREGMTDWAPQGATNLPPLPGDVPAAGGVVCAACGARVPESDAFLLGDAHYCAACKPQILQRIMEGKPPTSPAAEAMRTAHIKHEASVKSIGLLYYLGGAGLTLIGMVMLVSAVSGTAPGRDKPETIGIGVFMMVLAAGQIWVGTGLRRLRGWARIPTGILSGIGLLGFPLGTLINGYILYLVFSKKGATVFSPEYQDVIRQTPHIKYKTSIVVWILLGLILLVIIAAISASVFSRH